MRLGLMCVLAVLCFCKSNGSHVEHGKGNDLQKRDLPKESPVVAFHTYFGRTILVGRKGHAIRIPYNPVTLNLGNGYNMRKHAFIAPLSGLYMINVDGLSSRPGPGCIQLVKNGVTIDEGHTPSHWSTMVISRPILLKKGDSLFVVTCPSWRFTLHGGFTNSFSGFLIREM